MDNRKPSNSKSRNPSAGPGPRKPMNASSESGESPSYHQSNGHASYRPGSSHGYSNGPMDSQQQQQRPPYHQRQPSNKGKWSNGPPPALAASNSSASLASSGSRDSLNQSPQQAYRPRVSQHPPHERHMHDRLSFILANMHGSKVEVSARDATYEGVLHSASADADIGLVLSMARLKDADSALKNNTNPLIKTMVMFPKDVGMISVTGLDFNATELNKNTGSFATDTAISGQSGDIRERELVAWTPAGPNEAMALGGLDDDGRGWDQFAVNEKLFGVTTDYNFEEYYTTRLDRNDPNFQRREREAARLAAEIENGVSGTTTTNIHLLEERGLYVPDDDQMNEEDRYSSVIRDPNAPMLSTSEAAALAGGKYIPPAVRKQMAVENPSPSSTSPPQKDSSATKTLLKPLAKKIEGAGASPAGKPPMDAHVQAIQSFVDKEKLALGQVVQNQKSNSKSDKEERFKELKQFHKEFKLAPMPQKKDESAPAPTKEAPKEPTATDGSRSSSPAPASGVKKSASSFKFNLGASEFKPNVDAVEFVPSGISSVVTPNPDTSSFFGARRINKSPLSVKSALIKGFAKYLASAPKASSISPTWPFGSKSFRTQFSVSTPPSDFGAQQFGGPGMYGEPPMVPPGPPMGMGPQFPMDPHAPIPATGAPVPAGYYAPYYGRGGYPQPMRPFVPVSMSPGGNMPPAYMPPYGAPPSFGGPPPHSAPVYNPQMMGPPPPRGYPKGHVSNPPNMYQGPPPPHPPPHGAMLPPPPPGAILPHPPPPGTFPPTPTSATPMMPPPHPHPHAHPHPHGMPHHPPHHSPHHPHPHQGPPPPTSQPGTPTSAAPASE